MSYRLVSVLLIAGLTGPGVICPTAAEADGPLRFFSKIHAAKGIHHQGSPPAMSHGTPTPRFYPEYNMGNYAGNGYGMGVPTYNWGYFGAQSRPTVVSHKGYYGHYTQWGYRNGY